MIAPWENPAVEPDLRRKMLEDAYNQLVRNPLYVMLMQESRERERTGHRLLADPRFSGEQLKFYQGELQAWQELPALAAKIYDREESLIEQQPPQLSEAPAY